MSETLALAPLWRRLVSLCYDTLLLIALVLAGAMLFQLVWPGDAGSAVRRYTEFAYMVALLFGYFSWCWRRSGQTLAMKTWRLRLRSTTRNQPGWLAIAIRFTLVFCAFMPLSPAWIWSKHVPGMRWLLWLACAWAALPYLWALIDRDRQFLHDRLAGTCIELMPIAPRD
ncbi:RDD family protein [Chitinimonas sp.]|uniref:RDD family protein n=1 Tax=Chitinimonas sp. TaxID=1934313 RepID=UPI0035B1BAF9